MNFEKLNELVLEWAVARQIIPNSNPLAQAVKTTEELAELLKAICKGDKDEAIDAYGDILVTMIIGAALMNVSMVDALESAFNEIKNRKGYLGADGIFVKE